ncbi:hypothetical protein RhiirA5_399547 [Rhizophagus irregularis]|uniref:Ion transport domain-containing protein n=1 Tax=Rhizophagus irregularis TaxID=588596 RepID=A0A2N0PMH5_9GLOM|nr:hypothetical protein RhiirA5_399547 [Rhizophagus irregularis]
MANEIKDNNLPVNNPDTSRKSIDSEQEVIIIKHDVEKVGTFTEPFKKYMNAKSIKSNKNKTKLSYNRDVDGSNSSDGSTTNDNKYHIAICQNGKFVATFNTETLQIKLLENTDSIYKIIEQFKIGRDFTISQERQHTIIVDGDDNHDEDDGDDGKETTSTNDENFGWSIDISNLYTKDMNKYFIYVALSRIVDKDLTSTPGETRNGTTMIYRLELEKTNKNYKHTMKTNTYHISGISGICRFINESESEKVLNSESNKEYFTLRTIRRFVILNFDGIHSFDCKDNFVLSKQFYYPQCIKHELKALDSPTISDYINLLQSYIYDKYFLVENYKDSVQLLEVYNLEKMKLETITIRIENSQEKLIRKYNRNHFSISENKQLLCFTRGLQSVKLYFMENGLEAISKKFKSIEKIYLLEFIQDSKKLLVIGSSDPEEKKLKLIIWDMYNFEESETPIELDNFLKKDNLTTRLARIYGIILQIDDSGEVSSVFKELEEEKEKDIIISPANKLPGSPGKKPNGNPDKRHTIHYDKNTNPYFKPIVVEKEPWVLGDYDRKSYCLYQNKNGSEIETLQLIVGRSTIQVWHQITSDDKNKSKDELPNEGEPFLEYIWTNGIPVNQEREKTSLRIEEFEYGPNDSKLNDFKLNDFCLKVYWYEKVSKDESEDDLDELKIKDDDIEIIRMEKDKELRTEKKKGREGIIKMEKVIQPQDIIDKVNAVRYACKALEFINKRTKSLVNYTKEHHCEEMVAYINRIIWRFIKYKPDDFRLLDVRRNVMKNLILGDCDHLIKFILFGDNNNDEKINNLHIPRKTFWKKRKIINDDTEEYEITNVMELAIYHCRGREIKDTIIVAYLLEYYSRHATDYAGWMSTVSKALPLLFKYNYDDYVKKLFRKECFANQNYLSVQKHNIIIPVKYQERHSSHGIQFKAFEVNLRSDKIKLHSMIWETYKSITNTIYKKLEEWINKDFEKQPLALRVVPLPEFTINNRASQQNNPEGGNFLLNIFLFLFIPRWFILLYDPNTEIIKTKDSTFSGTATNPVNGQELMNVTMKADFDPTDRNDNPFAYFSTSIISAYYWLSGDFVQRDSFDFWAVEVFTFIASVLLVTILQNMLIAFMSGVYETATTKGRQALLRFRANQIANYEALNQVHYPHIKPDPKYIYYIGRSKHFETWYESRKDDGPIFSDFEKKSTFSKFVFEEKDYDEFSLWKYDIDFEGEIKKFNIMKKSLNNNIENLIKYFNQKNDKKYDDIDDIDIKKEIGEFKIKKNYLNDNIDNLINYFEDQKIKENGNVDINIEIGKFKTMKNNLNDNIENLIKIFEDQKNDNDADNIDINKKLEDLNDNIDNLIKNLVRKCNKNNLNDNIDELIKNLEDQKSDNDVNNNIEINKKIEILKAIKY